ncbi:MAG TPA: methyl-accepting chemotaxis protein, partial [Desulfomicrobiaceae bacterium]|nr:methyl-accepting chemotaxis protein [Desulfomicrobiaceae bacterium]
HAFRTATEADMELARTKLETVRETLRDLEEHGEEAAFRDERLLNTVRTLNIQVKRYSADLEGLWRASGYGSAVSQGPEENGAELVEVGLSEARQRGIQIFKEISLEEERYRQAVEAEVNHIADSASASSLILLLGLGVALVIAAIFSTVLPALIIRPVGEGVAFAGRLAKGDLTSRLSTDRQDEMGILAGSLNGMVDQLNSMLKDIQEGVAALVESSSGLRSVADEMASGAEGTVHRSEAVAAASEEMSSNMGSVAAAMEQAASNVNVVASAAEEMSNTIAEIARSADQARRVTGNSVTVAAAAANRFNELDSAAREIGEVTETISEISAQTNLLALNATIEAARAGEAGKGFAVVAGEIKGLAQQTAAATAEIARKIRGIQEVAGGAVGGIGEISGNIGQIDEMVSSIAVAVEQQSATTREIAENIQQASGGIREVTENAAQSSTVSGEIARDISEVSGSAGNMLRNSVQVKKEADDLAELAERLRTQGERFQTG